MKLWKWDTRLLRKYGAGQIVVDAHSESQARKKAIKEGSNIIRNKGLNKNEEKTELKLLRVDLSSFPEMLEVPEDF